MDFNKTLTQDQKSILKQFRQLTADCNFKDSSDGYLLRWLLTYDFDLKKTENQLRHSLEWRRLNRIDFIQEEFTPPEVLLKYGACAFIGRDKLGNSCLVRMGLIDIKGIWKSTVKEDQIKFNLLQSEMALSLYKVYSDERKAKYPSSSSESAADNILYRHTSIYDMQGLSMQHITHTPNIKSLIEAIKNQETHYPELAHRVFVINAPTFMSVGYQMVKHFISERSANKLSIFNDNSQVWKKELLTYIDADQLPACYGGTMTDPDGNPNCLTKCNMGGKVPKSYYLRNQY